MEPINHNLIEIALEKTQGGDFEKFCNSFFAAIIGKEYVPLGGMHDGGADGYIETNVYESVGRDTFMQASVTQNYANKIKQTIQRLHAVGRDPKELLYATSQAISMLDRQESDLTEELGVRITIRDRGYFVSHINDSSQTIQAFKSYLSPAVSYLKEIGSSNLIEDYPDLPVQTLGVFIGQELDRRRGKSDLLKAVTDSLILWSLEGTDPDKSIFLTKEQIKQKVLETLPTARTFFNGALPRRLSELASKGGDSRKINHHRKEEGYCLPYETRELIRKENVEDVTLKLHVDKILRDRISDTINSSEDKSSLIDTVFPVCHKTIHRMFYEQGLEMSVFLESGSDTEALTERSLVIDQIDKAIKDLEINPEVSARVADISMSVLRGCFYKSTEIERTYFRKLSRTYVLLFMLKNEPRIVEYFQSMSANFNLYVGTDLIVHSLSEHMLPIPDQTTKNALKVLRDSGSELILTDKALDEIWHHLITTNFEYQNNYHQYNDHITEELVHQIDKILIKAYFFARFAAIQEGKSPMTWSNYIGQFLTHEKLSKERIESRNELRAYLINEFRFKFENEDKMLANLDQDEINMLAEKILITRDSMNRGEESEKKLCVNAASTVLRIYRNRLENDERSGENPFGYKTWWLTNQSRIRGATSDLTKERGRYMMRPEFVLHFIANLPTLKQVQSSYDEIFPSILGIELGNRLNAEVFDKIMKKAKSAFNDMDDSRARVILAQGSEQLQSDFKKRYEMHHKP